MTFTALWSFIMVSDCVHAYNEMFFYKYTNNKTPLTCVWDRDSEQRQQSMFK